MDDKFFLKNMEKNSKGEDKETGHQKTREHVDRLFNEAFIKAQEILTENIDIRDFTDLYGKEIIERDLKEVEQLERIFKLQDQIEETEKGYEYAKVFEAIFNQQAEVNEWLGENVTTIVPSRWDDIKNGIDSIAEFEEENSKSHLALGIDIVLGSSGPQKKLSKIKNDIQNGKLARIKYFKTDDFRGELNNIPKIIIGIDFKTLEEITSLWMQKKNKELAKHRVQTQILLEAKMQLSAFKQYADRHGRERLGSIYGKSLITIDKILKSKNQDEADMDKIKQDMAFQSIEKYLEKEFSY